MKIFLSHSKRDTADVKTIWQLIEQTYLGKIHRWLDEYELGFERGISRTIESAILEDCDCVLIFLSEKSIGSDWLNREFKIALERENLAQETIACPILLDDIWDRIREKPFGRTIDGDERFHLILQDRSDEDYRVLARKICTQLAKLKDNQLDILRRQVSDEEVTLVKNDETDPRDSPFINRRNLLLGATFCGLPLTGYFSARYFPYPETTRKAELTFSLTKDAGYNDEASWQAFRSHLAKKLDSHLKEWAKDYQPGSTVTMGVFPDSHILWKMKMRQVEMAWIGTGTSIRAIRDAGSPYTPSLIPVSVKTNRTVKYRAVFIKHSEKHVDVSTIEQMGTLLKDAEKGVSFGIKRGSSNSGNSIPRIVLNSMGVTTALGEEEGHEDLISKVNSGDYMFACVASDILEMSRRTKPNITRNIVELTLDPDEDDLAAEIVDIVNDEYPSATLGWRTNLSPILKKSIESSFYTFEGKLDYLYPEEITFRAIGNFFEEYGKVVRIQEMADGL